MKILHAPRRFYLLSALILLVAILFADCGGGGGGGSGSGGGSSGAAGSGGASGTGATTGGSGSTGGTGTGGMSGSGSSGTGMSGGSTAMAATHDVLTYHNDIGRTGQNLNETILTPANVNATTFGKVGFFAVDGKVDGQPLYIGSLAIAGGTHNVLYVVTEHGSVFAFDADSGAQLWQVSTLSAAETPSDNLGCPQITPEIGITSTPVIDRSRGAHGTIYVVAMSKDASGGYHQRVHALDLATGAELLNGPTEVVASYPGTGANSSNGRVVFAPSSYAERAGLLLLGGVIYTTWTSHCDAGAYTGWVIGYSADTLQQTTVLNITPNGSDGAIWMSGTAPASDGSFIYLLDGNGTFDTTMNAGGFPAQGDFGNTYLKLGTTGGLAVADYFAMSNIVQESNVDKDLGSGGALVLPDLTDANGAVQHLTLGTGKDDIIYVLNRDSMGKFNAAGDNIYQEIAGQLSGGEFGMPAYFNGQIYFGSVDDHLKAFTLTNARLSATPSAQSTMTFPYPGTTPSISANGSANGIVWAAENGNIAALHAFDPANLATELYNSNQMGTRDQFGAGNKFITPMIANGKVYVGTTNGVAVFGLLKG
ncbi:Pyrrolo-quinoline quinone [Paraburkholderia ribeironis]|uniref:Pyrrolo-quinoline quinone n=1 Tax=Paraburkholderia ribeironis TaxID=1247936 RepID=A0A1N7S5W6_9BURK|nr:PQQ-binding-like beta-propeller repeat protein [Paraburkholderia ribeironis]SIT42801.1 Pyrrolo-quinoline quinone [Paraburkholderia ribeironis]